MDERAAAAWEAFCVGAVALVVLVFTASEPPAARDAVRVLLMARDCVELGACHDLGAPASVRPYHHGLLFIHFSAVVLLLGAGVVGVAYANAALWAAGVVAIFWVSRRAGRTSGLVAAAVLTLLLAASSDHHRLWEPTGVAFPAAMATWGLVETVRRPRWTTLLGTGFWIGLAISAHESATILVVGLVAAGLWGVRSAISTGVGVVGVAGVVTLVSPRTLGTNLQAALETGHWVWLLGCGVAIVVGLVRFAPARATPVAVLVTVVGAAAAANLVLGLVGGDVRFANGHAAFPAVALLCFEVARRLSARAGKFGLGVAVLTALVAFVWSATLLGQDDEWSLLDARAVAERAKERGWRVAQLDSRLQGPACDSLVAAVGLYSEPGPQPPLGAARTAWAVLRSPTSVSGLTQLRPGVHVREIESTVSFDDGAACYESGGEPVCEPLRPRRPKGPFRFVDHAYPTWHDIRPEAGRAVTIRYALRLQPASPAGLRFLAIADDYRECPWTIEAVEAARLDTPLPARRAIYDLGAVGGKLVFRRDYDPAQCPRDVDRFRPPCVLETLADEGAIRTLVEIGEPVVELSE